MSASDLLLDGEEARLRNDGVQTGEERGAASSKYLDQLVEAGKKQRQTILDFASRTDPDKAAQTQQLSRDLGLSADLIEPQQDEYARIKKVRDMEAALAYSPILRQQMMDPDFAKLAHDDLANAGAIERTLKAVGTGTMQASLGLSESVLRTPEALGRISEYAAQQVERTGLPWYLNPVRGVQGVADFFARGKVPGADHLGGASTWADKVNAAQQLLATNPDTFGPSFARMAQKGQQADAALTSALSGDFSALGSTLADPEAWAGFIGQAAPSLYTAVKSGGSLPVMGWLEAMQTANDAAEFEQKTGVKVDPGKYTQALAQVALINSWLEKIGLDKVLASKGGGLFGILRATLGEGATEGLQQLNSNFAQWLAYNPDQQLFGGVLASIMGGAGTGGGAHGMITATNAAVGRVAAKQQQADAAVQAANVAQQLAALAAENKLRGRDADAFGKFVQDAAEQGGRMPGEVFIDGATLANTLAQSGVDVGRIKEQAPSIGEQFDTALATDGQVRIPVGEFAAHLAGQPYTDTLIEHLRTSPDAPSLAEARAYLQSDQGAQLHDEIVRLAAEHAASMDRINEGSAIEAHIAEQLNQVGRFSEEVNRSYAALHGAFFQTMAERLGTTPAQLYQAYEANLRGEALPGAPSLSQGERGAFVPREFTTDGKPLIALLQNADLSSFLHESGHYFLESYADMAKAAPALQQDMQQLLDWFGVKDAAAWQGMTLEEKRQHHEKFARGFESYLYEGQAPSLELQGLFARFRSWLLRVYRSLRSELTNDVRGVMDRMLAIDTQIDLAEQARSLQPLFRTAEEAQRFGVDFAKYQALNAQAKADALSALESRSLRNMRWLSNAKTRAVEGINNEAAQARAAIRAKVQAAVEAEPAYRAMRWLKAGETTAPDGAQVKALAGHRLSIDALKAMYPAGALVAPEWQKLGYGAHGMLGKEGMHPDAVAEVFGFTSGDALVRTLLDTPPLEQAVEALTDQRMLEEHGDLADPASIERAAEASIHNEARQRMVAAELAALQSANRNSALVLVKAAKDMAARVIGQGKVGTLRPRQFTAAGAKAARAAEEALRRGDIEGAIAQKRTQLLNNTLARQAFEARDEIEAALAMFREVAAAKDEKTAQTRNMDLVNAARAILGEYGIGRDASVERAGRYMEALKAYDPELFAVLDPQIAAAVDGARPWRELSVDHLRALRDQVDSLWYMARRSREVEIDGRLVDREEITAALGARLDELGLPASVPGEGRAVTEGEKRIRYLQGARAALRRVEHWVDRMDSGRMDGVFRSFLWTPVSEAADRYRTDSARYLAHYRNLLKAIEPSLAPGMIEAPELGYAFGHARGGMGKVELLHAILHTGNESNLRKLLLGRGWGVERADGSIDMTRWEAFVNRMAAEGKLTKADFDFAQGVWDLLEQTKPLAQRTHREVFGRYFDEVTARPLATPFGTYRGGYVPALVDTFTTQDAAVHAELEAINQGNGYMFPATNRGFTKSRVEYNRPLALDLRLIGQHIDKVLLFAHLEGRVRDAMRILKAKGFSGKMAQYDAVAYTDMLLPWLNRAARQTVETPTSGWGGKLGDRFFRTMRSRAGMAAMFANVTNALQQITGLSISALKVKPHHLAGATVRYLRGPAKMAEEVAELSPFMAQRQHNEVMAMRQEIEHLLVNPGKYEKARAWSARHGYFLQAAFQNVVDTITWSAAYDQSVAAGESEATAIRAANSAVRETQGSLSPEDVSRWETGPAFVRLFTQFQSYFNMQANVVGTEFAKVAQDMGLRKGAGRLFYIYALGFMVPAVLSEVIVQAMKGGPGDDDKDGYLDDYLAAFFGSQFRTLAAMVPVIGQASVVMANTFNRKPYDDRMSTAPAVSMIESAVSAPHSVYKAIFENGKASRAIRDTLTLVAMATGIPVTALGKPLGYYADAEQGKVQPTGALDAARGAVSGAASPDSKR